MEFCGICIETKPTGEFFMHNKCSHRYCTICIISYITSKVRENVAVVRCPDSRCVAILETEFCRAILPAEVFERWGKAIRESLIAGSTRFYCPFKDCSGLLVKGGNYVTKSECNHCRRLYCAECRVPWHPELACSEVKAMNKEDHMMIELAKVNKWKRCPSCKFYVERTDGCLHITCRCRYEFCYGCGSKWGNTHESVCHR